MAVFTTYATFATNQIVTIGTNRFGFVFEDTILTTNMQARIIEDWKVLIAPWTNNIVSIKLPTNNTNGKLKFNVLYQSSQKNMNCNTYEIINKNDSMFINLSKTFTDSYFLAFQVVDSKLTEVAKIRELVSVLHTDILPTISSNQFHNIYYYHKYTPEMYTQYASVIKDDFLRFAFYSPSILSFSIEQPNYMTHPEAALWCWVPVVWKNDNELDYIPAIYIDGRWKIHPLIF